MMYKTGQSLRLHEITKMGYNPTRILDIGAHSGQFYGWAKYEWPISHIWMIEANSAHNEALQKLTLNNTDEYLITALGDEEKEVIFYTRKDKPWTEGASYYKEINYNKEPHLVMEIKIQLQRLDDLFTDDTVFDLIKLDTQGSEIDIIKGGRNISSRADVVLLEASVIPTNENSPLKSEVIKSMSDFGFEFKMSIGEHYDKQDVLVQEDLIFLNRNKVNE